MLLANLVTTLNKKVFISNISIENLFININQIYLISYIKGKIKAKV